MLVTGFLLWKPGFDNRPVLFISVLDEVALGEILLRVLWFYPVTMIQPLLHTYLNEAIQPQQSKALIKIYIYFFYFVWVICTGKVQVQSGENLLSRTVESTLFSPSIFMVNHENSLSGFPVFLLRFGTATLRIASRRANKYDIILGSLLLYFATRT